MYKITSKIRQALRKRAPYKRVAFIDVNKFDNTEQDGEWWKSLVDMIRVEEKTNIHSPECYLFVTNFPYHLNLDDDNYKSLVFALGFKLLDFYTNFSKFNIRRDRISRNKHLDMHWLFSSLRQHNDIPITYDGEIPEFAFSNIPRLLIGNKYIINDTNGNEVIGVLVDATMIEGQRLAWCIYNIQNGERIIGTYPILDEEYEAYRCFPNTFFGVYKETTKQAESGLEMYDFLYESYQTTPKETLLKLMERADDFENLTKLDQNELAIIYCERMAFTMMSNS